MAFILRDYQDFDIGEIRKKLALYRSILYVLPTGGGKTRVFSYMAHSAHKKGNSSCIVVHRQELVIQSSIALAELGLRHRVIATPAVLKACLNAHLELFGESFIDQSSDVMVASVQTLVRRLDLLAYIKLLIIDEAHHTAAGQWLQCFQYAKSAKIIGVTATPERLDGKGLGQFYEVMIVGLPMLELIERGYLCKPKVYAPKQVVSLEGVRTKFGDYVSKDVNARMDTPTLVGNAVAHYRELCPGVPAIAYCCSVDHAIHVAEKFREAGYRAAMVDGKTKGVDRRRAIKELGQGKLDVLTSCDIISEGTDIPLVGCGIMLRPTKSLTLWLQQAGRVLRPYPDIELMGEERMQVLRQGGQHFAFIIDHANNTATHGLPQQPRDWELTADRVKTRKNTVPAIACPECRAWHAPAKYCPECGYEYRAKIVEGRMPDTIEGKLEAVEYEKTTSWSHGEDITKMPLKRALAMATSDAQVYELARARGFKAYWAINVIKGRKNNNHRGRLGDGTINA